MVLQSGVVPTTIAKESTVSRFRKLSHTLWHCQYHIVWTPKYRFRILSGQVSEEVSRCIRAFCEHLKCEVVELNIQIDMSISSSWYHRKPRYPMSWARSKGEAPYGFSTHFGI